MSATAASLIESLLAQNATDLYLTVDAPASLRHGDRITGLGTHRLTQEDILAIAQELLPEDALQAFAGTMEYNTALHWQYRARLRINLFRQRQHTGMVIRHIRTQIPTLDALGLPGIYAKLIMEKRGLILVTGPSGSGKSTSLASMLEHRNLHGSGHIVTIEDPVEYVLEHKNCIITQRDVGIDTHSFAEGLKNALRQTPDVIVIGEIRDQDTMQHAIDFAETGHVCLATLHANNANQAIERVVNFFPSEKCAQVLLNLSLNLKAVLSQRLVPNTRGGRSLAIEILLNEGLIRNLIQEGRIREIKECMEKNRAMGMQSFDQALADMCVAGLITEEVALAEADNPGNLRLALKQHAMARGATKAGAGMTLINRQQF